MNVYMAGTSYNKFSMIEEKIIPLYRLHSFYYISDWETVFVRDKKFKGFMLDSGAFTFMQDKSKTNDWNEYIKRYADYINKNRIELFIELDIDSVVGLPKVLQLRKQLEQLTNKQCIPVWHKSRGKDDFLQMIKDYSYVAIGGIVAGEIKRKDFKYLHWFINKAHENDCKIHGLGFTPANLKKYNFDSVDSKGWTSGVLGRYLYKFTGDNIIKIKFETNNKYIPKMVSHHNFQEWIKYQKYMGGLE